jgi:ABC-type transport system substrate-binding protein
VRYLGFNLEREPMSSPSFRDALALLLDRGEVAEVLAPGSDPAYTVLSPSNGAWYDNEAASKIRDRFDGTLEIRLSSALAGLEAAGYTWTEKPGIQDGSIVPGSGLTIAGRPPAPLTILTAGDEYDPARPEYAKEIESVLELLGFDVRPVVTDFNSVIDLAFTPKEDGARPYDMYLLGWTLGNPALPDYYAPLFSKDGAVNSTGYSSDGFDEALAKYQASTSSDEALTALWEMESILADDQPYLVLYHPEITEAYRSDRVSYGYVGVLGGIQGRLGGLGDLIPKS